MLDLLEPMLDSLRSRFELQGLAIAQLPETLEHQIIEAGQVLADALLSENKIIVIGQGDSLPIASTLVDELIDSSNMERPPLPGVLIHGKSGIESVQRQLQANGKAGDVMFAIQSSLQRTNRVQDERLTQLCNFAQTMGIKSILIGNSELSNASAVDCIQMKLDYGSRMNYLCSVSTVSLTLISLVDYHLFEQPI